MLENHVAEYKEIHITCDTCKGLGCVPITAQEVFEVMEHTTLEHALSIYKQYRINDGSIDCKDCDAMGSWTLRS